MSKQVLNEMFENLLHIGNKKNYWNPKMKNYIYGTVNGVHVINLTQTVSKLEEVKNELKELHGNGKKILFVGTKLQARDAIAKMAAETGHYYVSEKWVPGLLTNFKTIKKRIATYLKLIKDSESGALDVLTKKEKAAKMLELEKLDKAFKGLKEMKYTPDAIFVVDGIFEEQAVREANSLRIPAYAIMNTNGDDTVVENLVPANTNSVKSIDYITAALSKAFAGTKVSAAPRGGRVQKMDATKVSGEKKAPAKKAAAPKVEEKTEA
jgi:small subunit ribosomal protein S2